VLLSVDSNCQAAAEQKSTQLFISSTPREFYFWCCDIYNLSQNSSIFNFISLLIDNHECFSKSLYNKWTDTLLHMMSQDSHGFYCFIMLIFGKPEFVFSCLAAGTFVVTLRYIPANFVYILKRTCGDNPIKEGPLTKNGPIDFAQSLAIPMKKFGFMVKRKRGLASYFWVHKMHIKELI